MRIAEIFSLGNHGRSDDYGHRGHDDHYGYRRNYSYGSYGKGHRGYGRSGHYNRGLLGILGG